MSDTLAENEFTPAADDDPRDSPVAPQEPDAPLPAPEAPPTEAPQLAPEAPPPAPDGVQTTRMERCERRIGYVFEDKELLREALTHASSAEHRLASNERLEFLGDAILGAIVCELLFRRYPEYQEGDLTKIKSAVVSRQSCAKISEALGLQEFLIVGRGVSASPSIPPSWA